MQQMFYVGSYTASMGGRGEGIYRCVLDTESGEMQLLGVFKMENPSYLILDKSRKYAFAVQESGQDLKPHVHSFRISDGGLELLSKYPTPGDYACHLDVDADNQFLAVANYGSGDIMLYRLQDGVIAEQLDHVQHYGQGTNPERQEGPHAHATLFSPDHQHLLVIDLGLDEVRTYTFKTGRLRLAGIFKTRAGAGPRHLAFHPSSQYLFVLNELDSTLILAGYKHGVIKEIQTLGALPQDYRGETWAAAIHVLPDGKTIYTSNRVHDSISVFAFDEATERLELIQHMPSGGKIPRDFSPDPSGKWLVTAHQKTDDLFSFRIAADGTLEPSGHRLELGTPICLKFL